MNLEARGRLAKRADENRHSRHWTLTNFREDSAMTFNAACQFVVSILTVAATLSLVAIAVSWLTRQRQPALEHACWVIVLLRLVAPPVVPLAIPGYPEWNIVS